MVKFAMICRHAERDPEGNLFCVLDHD